jgi:hypothetical protein
MKRVFSSPIIAVTTGLALRLFLVLKFPAGPGDTVLYEQIATNWVKHGVYAMNVSGVITPVDLRMPGYPAFLAVIYALTGRTGESARLWVMLAQVAVDLATCFVTAGIAAVLVPTVAKAAGRRRVFNAALWLAALCPFTANYAAVPLTEVFAVFFTAAAMLFFCLLAVRAMGAHLVMANSWPAMSENWLAGLGSIFAGIGTLFRPETPLVAVAAWVVITVILISRHQMQRWIRLSISMAVFLVIPLVPWAARNAVTLHEVQFLAPKDANLPGELVPHGFMAWEKTWLYRVRDSYLASWKLNQEVIQVEDLPARAFDSEEEKQRVANILEQYNNDLTLTPEEDAAFYEIARERQARHPLRTRLWLPLARAVAMWFTPHIELLPISGDIFPLAQKWDEDRLDQCVTVGFFLLNISYIGLACWGTWLVWRGNAAARAAVAFLLFFIVLRTAFLTTLETPEPRYVLEFFPAILALGADIGAGPRCSPG